MPPNETIKKLRIKRLKNKIDKYEAKHAEIDSVGGKAYSKHMLPDKMFKDKYLKWKQQYKELSGEKHW